MIPAFSMLLTCLAAVGIGLGLVKARRPGLYRFLTACALQSLGRRRRAVGDVHLILCIADHFEPKFNGAAPDLADARVARWVREYPERFRGFQDSDGRPPRYSFFYPIDHYEPAHVEALAGLCRAGFGEIEVHLHHDDDTSENLRTTLLAHKEMMASRHGIETRDRVTGEKVYAFIHGDWALDNSRPDGRCCGVNDELDVLRETGCYADFTMPSYPSATQTRKINSIYYATDDPRKPKSHDQGIDVGADRAPKDSLLLIQGPLALDWSRPKWGIFPRIENGCLQGNQPARIERVDAWLRAGVQVATRPDWYFVKLHTHGAPEGNQEALLGSPMVEFHEALARRSEGDPSFHYHYVTAREMVNLVKAAEAGWKGTVEAVRDRYLVQSRQDAIVV